MEAKISRRAFLAGLAAVTLAGCSSDDSGEEPIGSTSDDSASEKNEEKQESAEIGEPVVYESMQGGEFKITVNGLEHSQEMNNSYQMSGGGYEGYSVCMLLLTIENVSCEDGGEPAPFSRVWLEDTEGISMSPMNSGYGYGEYELALDFIVGVNVGQKKYVAVPYSIPEGMTDFTVDIDGVNVPVTLTEGTRPVV